MPKEEGFSSPGKGNHPNSRENLNPIQPGEVRNPKGRNQYTYRENTEKEFAKLCEERIAKTLRRAFDRADEDSTADLVAILARAFPAVAKVDVELPGADIAGLANALDALASKRRAPRDDREPDDTAEGSSE